MRPPIKIEEVEKRLFETHNGTIVMSNYYSLNSYADFKNVVCGHEWSVTAAVVVGGHNCPTCAKTKLANSQRMPIEEVLRRIENKHGDKIIVRDYVAVGKQAEFECAVCGYIWNTTPQSVINKTGCLKCSITNKSGSSSRLWKGGITKLRSFIRESNGFEKWQEQSMKACNYKCVLTNSKKFHIHHLYPLNNIIRDALLNLGLEKYDFIGKYSEEDLMPIIDEIMKIHYRYPLGVCIEESIHELFHKIYTKDHCTPEQFYEFVDRIKTGEIKI